MGGIPIATALSLNTGIPVVFVRKEAKPMAHVNLQKESISKIKMFVLSKMLLQLVDKLN